MMGTPIRKMMARSQISSRGREDIGETGTERVQGSKGHTAHSFHPQSWFWSSCCASWAWGPQRNTPGYREPGEIPHLRHLLGPQPPTLAQNVHNTMLAAPFRPVYPILALCPFASRTAHLLGPDPRPQLTHERRGQRKRWLGDRSGGGYPTNFPSLPQINVRVLKLVSLLFLFRPSIL